MSLDRISQSLATKFELDSEIVYQILRSCFELVEFETIAKGRCQIRGMGVFHLQSFAAKLGRHPITGESIPVPAHARITFRHGLDRQRALFGEKAAPRVEHAAQGRLAPYPDSTQAGRLP